MSTPAVTSADGRDSRPARRTTRNSAWDWKLAVGIVAVAGLLAASLLVGAYDTSEMLNITRIPRTIALVLAGAAMALSGLVMQLLTQNRFVEPTTTGTTEWAAMGLLFAMIIFPNPSLTVRMVSAVVFAFVGTVVFFLFLRRVSLRSSLVVPIVGIMLGAVISSISTFVALQVNMLQQLGIWFAGSFTSVLRGQYEVLWLVAFVVVAVWILADRLTAAGLGQDLATTIGVNYNRVLLIGTLMIAFATGVVTVVVGNLPFVGLIVPNVVSLIRGDDLRSNLPWVCLLGIGIVTVCDLLGRLIIMPFEIPVSVILGIVGAVVFIGLLLSHRKGRI